MFNTLNKILISVSMQNDASKENDSAVALNTLKSLLAISWNSMGFYQRVGLLRSEAVWRLFNETSSRPVNMDDVVNEYRSAICVRFEEISDSYSIEENDNGMHYWQNETEAGDDFYDIEDAMENAIKVHDLETANCKVEPLGCMIFEKDSMYYWANSTKSSDYFMSIEHAVVDIEKEKFKFIIELTPEGKTLEDFVKTKVRN